MTDSTSMCNHQVLATETDLNCASKRLYCRITMSKALPRHNWRYILSQVSAVMECYKYFFDWGLYKNVYISITIGVVLFQWKWCVLWEWTSSEPQYRQRWGSSSGQTGDTGSMPLVFSSPSKRQVKYKQQTDRGKTRFAVRFPLTKSLLLLANERYELDMIR